MISYLRGKYLDRTDEGNIIIDVNGIGFEVNVTAEVLGRIEHNAGEETELYTYMQVKEDGMSLFGFTSLEEISVFKKIIGVSGIGPKGAMSILSTMSREQLILAVIEENSDIIAKAPGIGKKTAAKLVLELKDKFKLEDALSSGASFKTTDVVQAQNDSSIVKDAIAALVALGYSAAESTKAVRSVELTEGMTVDMLLSMSLKNF